MTSVPVIWHRLALRTLTIPGRTVALRGASFAVGTGARVFAGLAQEFLLTKITRKPNKSRQSNSQCPPEEYAAAPVNPRGPSSLTGTGEAWKVWPQA